MADDPASPTNFWPASPASSVTTERAGSPSSHRALAREVDHIKSLLSRTQVSPRQSEGSITAQVFRRQSGGGGPVSQARIYHELDLLKKRIKHDSDFHHLRPPSAADPDESESEAEEVPDERDEELESIREELAQVRQQREEWVEAAESRIDKLMEQKEGLADLLDENRQELKSLQRDKERLERLCEHASSKTGNSERELRDVRRSLQEAESENQLLQSSLKDVQSMLETVRKERQSVADQLEFVQQSLKDVRSQLEDARAERERSDASTRNVNVKAEELKKLKSEVEVSLAEISKRASVLEQERNDTADRLRKALGDQDNLQQRHDKVVSEAEQSRQSVRDLETRLHGIETTLSQAREEHQLHRKQVEEEIMEHKKRADERERDLEMRTKDIEDLSGERAQAKSRTDELEKERDEHKGKLEAAMAEKEELSRWSKEHLRDAKHEHERRMQALTDEHEAERVQLQRDAEKAKSAQVSQLEQVRSELGDSRAKHEQSLRAVKEELEQSKRSTAEAKEAHKKEMQDARTEHAKTVGAVKDELAASKRDTEESGNKLKAKLADLAGRLATEAKEARVFRQQSQRAEELHQERVKDLESSLKEMEQHLTTSEQKLFEKNDELAQSRKRMSDLQSGKAELEERLKKLSEALADARSRQTESGEMHKSAVAGLKANYETQLESLRSAHSQEIDRLRAENTSVVQHAARDVEIRVLEGLEQLARKHSDETGQLESRFGEEREIALRQAKEEHDAAVAELIAKHDNRTQSAAADAQRILVELRNSHAAELNKLRDEHERASKDHEESLAAQEDKHNRDSESAISQSRSQMERMQASHATEIAGLKAEHDRSAEQAKSAHDDAVNATDEQCRKLEDSHRAALSGLRDRYEEKTAQLQREHEAEVERLSAQLSRDVEKAERRLAALRDENEQRVDLLKKGHESMVSALTAELDDVKAQHSAASEQAQHEVSELKAEHKNHMQQLRDEHESNFASLRDQLQQAFAAEVENLKAEHTRQVAEFEKHRRELDEAAQAASERCSQAQSAFNKTLADSEAAAKARHAETREGHNAEVQKLKHVYSQQVQEAHSALDASRSAVSAAQGQHQRARDALRNDHNEKIEHIIATQATERQKLLEEHLVHVSSVQQDHQTALEQLAASKVDHNNELQRVAAQREAEKRTVYADRDAQLATAHKEHQKLSEELAVANVTHGKELDAARADHHARIEALQRQRDDAAAEHAARSAEAERRHHEVLERATKEARDAGTGEVEALKRSHEDALAKVQAEAQKHLETQLSGLEEKHQAALNAALAEVSEAAEDKARKQGSSHGQELMQTRGRMSSQIAELEGKLRDATQLHEKQLGDTANDHQLLSQELTSKLQETEHGASELMVKHESQGAELYALLAKLDAAHVEHAEMRSSLEGLLQVKEHQVAQVNEEMLSLKQQVAALQHNRSEVYPPGVQETGREHENVASAKDEQTPEELQSVRRQLDAVKLEQKEAQASLQQKIDETSELARQNDYLVKQLAALHAQLEQSGGTRKSTNDALVQTEPFVSSGNSRQHTPRSSVQDEYTLPIDLLPSRSGSLPSGRTAEPRSDELGAKRRGQKTDVAISHATKATRELSKLYLPPGSPPAKRVNGAVDSAGKTRSFEEYLQQAQTELSELGSVISANEALFAQKIEEHVGDLQKAKDMLAREYQEKFDALVQNSERMEKDVTAKQASEFVKERNQLVAKYGADHEERSAQAAMLTSLPVHRAKALRSAEERLVSEYNRRIAKRKSKIRLKHAEDFQVLTQDYDRKIATLLSDREMLEGDLSVAPAKFEDDLDEIDAKSVQLEAEKVRSVHSSPQTTKTGCEDTTHGASPSEQKEPRSQLPRRIVTSMPRTPTSIPRAVPFQGSRDSSQAGAQPLSPHTPEGPRSSSERHTPLPQRSLMRVKSPPDGPITRRQVSESRASEKWASPSSAKDNAARDFGIEPRDFEGKAKDKIPQRAPADRRVAVASPKRPRTAEPSTSRSLRHSSGSIYRQGPRQD